MPTARVSELKAFYTIASVPDYLRIRAHKTYAQSVVVRVPEKYRPRFWV